MTEYTQNDLESMVEWQFDALEEKDRVIANLSELVKEITERNDIVMTNLTELFAMLDYEEESDGGKMFHPVTISCCRVMMVQKLNTILNELKSQTVKYNNCEGAE